MKMRDFFIIEAAYPGNIGAMEVFKFYQIANDKEKEEFDAHLARKEYEDAWEVIQRVTKVRLHGLGKK